MWAAGEAPTLTVPPPREHITGRTSHADTRPQAESPASRCPRGNTAEGVFSIRFWKW